MTDEAKSQMALMMGCDGTVGVSFSGVPQRGIHPVYIRRTLDAIGAGVKKPKQLCVVAEIDEGSLYLYEPSTIKAIFPSFPGVDASHEPAVIISKKLHVRLAGMGYNDADISLAVELLIRKQNGAKP